MKKFLISIIFILSVFSFVPQTVKAFDPACNPGPYSRATGKLCTAEELGTRCPQGDLYSTLTGKRCDAWDSKPAKNVVTSPLVMRTKGALPSASLGVNYSTELIAVGGTGVYNWSVFSGSLPPGLTINQAQVTCIKAPCATNATIVGEPSRSGVYSFILKVVSGTQQVTRALSISTNTY